MKMKMIAAVLSGALLVSGNAVASQQKPTAKPTGKFLDTRAGKVVAVGAVLAVGGLVYKKSKSGDSAKKYQLDKQAQAERQRSATISGLHQSQAVISVGSNQNLSEEEVRAISEVNRATVAFGKLKLARLQTENANRTKLVENSLSTMGIPAEFLPDNFKDAVRAKVATANKSNDAEIESLSRALAGQKADSSDKERKSN